MRNNYIDRRRLCATLCAIILLTSSTALAYPNRIISLKPNITEILFAIGARDQIVGVTTWCNRPEESKKITRVADYINPNIEKIMMLEPDLVISSEENSSKRPIEYLQKSGINVLLLPFQTLEDLLDSIARLGEVTGHKDNADRLTTKIREAATLRKTNKKDATAIIIVGTHPLIAAGPNTFLGEMLELAGGTNIISSKMPYPHVNMETVIAKNPDLIIDLSMGSEQTKEGTNAIPDYWKGFDLNAVKNKRVYNLDISDFRAGPRLDEQINKLGKLINETPDS